MRTQHPPYCSRRGTHNCLRGIPAGAGRYRPYDLGFGLFFSYLRNYNWSGLGFTFFITSVVFQLYFLVNGLWIRIRVDSTANLPAVLGSTIKIYLNDEVFSAIANSTHQATAVGAAKCALALSIAFAAVGGRAGFLEAFILCLVGTVMQQLNQKVVMQLAFDYGGSISVFLFGGATGTILALLLSWRQKDQFFAHKEYTSNKLSRTLALLGAVFCWVFFPVLNMDISPELFLFSNAGLSTILCISSSVVTMTGICLVIDQRLDLRCLITSVIAGGVIVGSSSAVIYNPMGALLLGILAAVLQYVFVRVEVRFGMKPFCSNGVFFLFLVQGFIGGLASAVFRAINQTSGTFGSEYATLDAGLIRDQGGQVGATFASLGIGAVTGALVFLLVMCVGRESRKTFYHDKGNWTIED